MRGFSPFAPVCSRGPLCPDDAKQRGPRGRPLHPPEQADQQAGGAGGPPEHAGGRVPADHLLPLLFPGGTGGE